MISKGIVIEVKKYYGIVLNGEGAYEKVVKKGSLSEGDRIIYTREDIYEGNQAGCKKVYRGLISAAMVIFAIAMAFGFENLPSQNVYAVVSMDINPSIQYYLDKDDFVIRAEAMNEDGLEIVDCGLEGLSIEKAINRTLEEAERTHYLKRDSKIIVSAVDLKSGKADYAEQIAGKIFEEPMIAQKRIEVFVLEVDRDDYEESRSMETSLGKYKVYEICENGSCFSLEEINGMKASEIIENSMIDEEKVHVFKNLGKDEEIEMPHQPDNVTKEPEKTQNEKADQNEEMAIMAEVKNEKASGEEIASKGRNPENVKNEEAKNAKMTSGENGNRVKENMQFEEDIEEILNAENEKAEREYALVEMSNDRNEEKEYRNSNSGNGVDSNKEESMKSANKGQSSGQEKHEKERVARNDDLASPLNVSNEEKIQTDPGGGNGTNANKDDSAKAAKEDASGEPEKQEKVKVAKNEKSMPSSNADIESLPKNQGSKEKESGKNEKYAEPAENSSGERKNENKLEKEGNEGGKKVKIVAFQDE
ncbi:MAG: hypothetical protein C0604_03210 [Clostridiales bacterium]|nr:MAG: hypothetical protein C0604_03210 [Clostridiales bacterium]